MSASGVVRGEQASIRWLRWPLGIALVGAVVAVFLLGSQVLGGYVSTDDAFVEVPMVYVAAQVPGRVSLVLAEEHEHVEQGQALLQLDATEYEIELARAEASLAMTRSRVVQAEAASASADADRKAAVVEQWRTERELSRIKSLRSEGTASQRDLDTAQAAYEAAAANASTPSRRRPGPSTR